MPKTWLPFGAKVTASKPDTFGQAIARLTLIYTLILVIQMTISGFTTYNLFNGRIDSSFSRIQIDGVATEVDQRIVTQVTQVLQDRAQKELTISILIGRIIMLVVGSILAYFLARVTFRPVEEASTRQRLFLSNASHELRTPIAILRTNLENELHAAGTLPNAAKISSNLEEVERISQLVESLMLLARLNEPKQAGIATQEIPIHELLDQTIERFAPLAEKYSVSISSGKVAKVFAVTSPEMLLHGLENVIKNAILYNRNKGEVVVQLEKGTNETFAIVVRDTGIGIPAKALPTIFDRFTRAKTSRSRDGGGSGLGLAIAQTSIQQIGGSITITSEINKGTIVTITLPRATRTKS
jgi:signal transduction histidine kinase